MPDRSLQSASGTTGDLPVVCLPYAGGGAAAFHRLRAALPTALKLAPMCLPGRETRIAEPPVTDLRSLAGQLADELSPELDRPWAVVGYSMGAWLAFELLRELRRRGKRLPEICVVAASRAPHVASTGPPLHKLPDEQFVTELRQRFDGIPPAVCNDEELLGLLLPVLRADVTLVETYEYSDERPLDVELLALGGTDDPSVSAVQLAAWRPHTTAKFSARLVPGGHFFLFPGAGGESDDTRGSIQAMPGLRIIVQRLMRLVDMAPRPQQRKRR